MEFLPPAIDDYASAHTSPETPVLAALNRETNLKVLYPRMLSGHVQGRILSFLSQLKRPKRILEIGTYTGYSAICLAEGLREDGKLITIDLNAELKEMAESYFKRAGIADKVQFIVGNAQEVIPTLKEEFDLIFIDADKEGYINYLELVLPKMPSGGVILADNVLWSGRVIDQNVNDKETLGLRNFNKFVTNHPGVEHVLLPVRDGVMMIIKK